MIEFSGLSRELTLEEAQKKIIQAEKLEQFKKIIIDINNKINNRGRVIEGVMISIMTAPNQEMVKKDHKINKQNIALGLAFDYDICNEYAKIIIDKTDINNIEIGGLDKNRWQKEYSDITIFKNIEKKISAAKSFIIYCKESENKWMRYKFIFWSLLVLTVDKNRAEEHLSLICDFAKLLNITNDEFEDIIYVIKNIYNEGDGKYIFKTELIPGIFNAILNLENKLI